MDKREKVKENIGVRMDRSDGTEIEGQKAGNRLLKTNVGTFFPPTPIQHSLMFYLAQCHLGGTRLFFFLLSHGDIVVLAHRPLLI